MIASNLVPNHSVLNALAKVILSKYKSDDASPAPDALRASILFKVNAQSL